MHRRSLLSKLSLGLTLAALPVTVVLAHTPYRFWDVFRKRNMVILTSHQDYTGDDIGDLWVATLRQNLPLSRALVSRTQDLGRMASLLKTDQVKLAVLSHEDARQMFAGDAPFESFKPLELQIMVDNGKYLLVTRPDVPLYHGYLVTRALMDSAASLKLTDPGTGRHGMAIHPGALAFYKGEKIDPPPPPPDQ
jgi:hypothetical protein